MGPSFTSKMGFRPLALRARIGTQLIRFAADVGNHIMTNRNLTIVGTGAVERLAPLNASFSASATLYRPIQPSGNAWNHEICVVEFLEAYQLDSVRCSGNVRPIPFR